MSTKIKICGLTRPCDIEAVNRYMPEYCGFVFWKGSKKRYIKPEDAAELIGMLSPDIKSVGVFLDEPTEDLISIAEVSNVDIIQLHGSEDEAYIREVQTRLARPVIKAFKVKSREDLEKALVSPADHIMLDSGAGTGRMFCWELVRDFKRDFFLAGGLDPDNAKEAIAELDPFCLDVSSGVETDGVKDEDKIRRFIANARNA
ncbi:MAG: phosphoribosylanthranilate isomerase [Saccharofermentans sp.]|nr:phosphoribosylanthranilate isomerase [Saccharofermentans sp.]